GLAVDLIDAPARLRLGSVAALAERILAVGNADEERRDLLHAGGEVALLVRLRDGAVEVRGGHRDDRGRRDERSEHASMVRGHPRAGKEDPPRLALGRLAAWGKVRKLLLAVRDAAARQVVWGQLELHAVSGQDADAELAHLARRVRQHRVLVVELDAVVPAGELFAHGPFDLDPLFLLRQANPR